jgi:hypothetical protein
MTNLYSGCQDAGCIWLRKFDEDICELERIVKSVINKHLKFEWILILRLQSSMIRMLAVSTTEVNVAG